MTYIDFAVVKASVSLEDAMCFLNLTLKKTGNQWRGKCPTCDSSNDRALVITNGKGYYCFTDNKGGDVIALVSHIKAIRPRDAAVELAEWKGLQEAEAKKEPKTQGFDASEYARNLVYDHKDVQALGLDPERAQSLSIGYAKQGIHRGRICFPLFEDGKLIGFAGYNPKADQPFRFP